MKHRRVLVLAAALALAGCGRPLIEVDGLPQGVLATPTPPSAPAGGGTLVDVVAAVQRGVVSVLADTLDGSGQSVGTGFVVRREGVVVTNYHVVARAARIVVITAPPNPRRLVARAIGGDPDRDLAVLQVDADDLTPLVLGRSSDLRLGQEVVAIGYALGLGAEFRGGGPTVTAGIVSALSRTVEAQDPAAPQGVRTYTGVIQTDAAINPGNSGGPLINLRGEVVGINTAGASDAENVGFAIPIDQARRIIDEAVENPSAAAGYLGVATETVTPALAVQLALAVDRGAYVVSVAPSSAAEDAGIEAGDVIVGLGGSEVGSSEDLADAIAEHDPGDRVGVEVVRPDGTRVELQATLGVRPLP